MIQRAGSSFARTEGCGRFASLGEHAGLAQSAEARRDHQLSLARSPAHLGSWLRQNDVPTWVLQELGGWKSETMVRRYAHLSVKHLQPYADQLIFRADAAYAEDAREPAEAYVTKSPARRANADLQLVACDGVSV